MKFVDWIKVHANFLTKTVSLVLIVAALLVYQGVASVWSEEVEANEAAIAEVESYNAEVLTAQSESEWADGTYSGTGDGFGGEISLTVTIEDGTISDITIVSASGEDDAYFSTAISIIDDIISAQSADVDTVSGATFSSTGIRDAVEQALSEAVSANE